MNEGSGVGVPTFHQWGEGGITSEWEVGVPTFHQGWRGTNFSSRGGGGWVLTFHQG